MLPSYISVTSTQSEKVVNFPHLHPSTKRKTITSCPSAITFWCNWPSDWFHHSDQVNDFKHLDQGRTGVFPWSVIDPFSLTWFVKTPNSASWFVNKSLGVTREINFSMPEIRDLGQIKSWFVTALGYLAVLSVLVTLFLKTPLPITQPTVLKHLVKISMSIISIGTTQANDMMQW